MKYDIELCTISWFLKEAFLILSFDIFFYDVIINYVIKSFHYILFVHIYLCILNSISYTCLYHTGLYIMDQSQTFLPVSASYHRILIWLALPAAINVIDYEFWATVWVGKVQRQVVYSMEQFVFCWLNVNINLIDLSVKTCFITAYFMDHHMTYVSVLLKLL